MDKENKSHRCRGYLFILHKLLGLSVDKIAKECGVSQPAITYWIRKFNKKRDLDKKICESCGIVIDGCLKGCTFTNIFQNPPIHYFCSLDCKIKWIFQKARK